MTAILIFLFALALFAYPFAVYPLMMLFVRSRHPKMPVVSPDAELPTVTLLICALNEQKVIGDKLENSLRLRYPAGKLKIMVVSDGSTDRTAEIVRSFIARGIDFTERPKRRGKIANLNEFVPLLESEIVVLSDANVIYDDAAILRLVEPFSDPSVGCVSGRVILENSGDGLDGATKDYYSVEWRLQEAASEIYSMAGADGAMYAFRKELFQPCPPDTLIEDFVIPMAFIAQGKRVVFQPDAIGREEGAQSLREEFRRKARIAAGAAQAIGRGHAWPRNAPPRFWFVLISHKLLRWLSPLSGAAALGAAFALPGRLSWYVLAAAAAFALLALLKLTTRRTHALLDAPFYFLFAQVAVAIGLFKGIAGLQSVLWEKADR